MSWRHGKSTHVVTATCTLLASVIVSICADAQQLPQPLPPEPIVIGETPAIGTVPPSRLPQGNALPRPTLASPDNSSLPSPSLAPLDGSSIPQKRPSLGIVAEERPDRLGLTVIRVRELSPADQAGVRESDILTGLNGRPTKTIEDVSGALSTLSAGEPVTIEVSRGDKLFELRATMSDAPPPSVQSVPASPRSVPQTAAPMRGRGVLGITVEDAGATAAGSAALRGALVVDVAAGSPAESIGIRPGDIVVSMDGKVMYGARELTQFMQTAQAGQTLEIGYYQDRVLQRKDIRLAGTDTNVQEEPIADQRPAIPPIAIGPGATVDDILEGVGRTLDGFLGPRMRRETPAREKAQPQTIPVPRLIPTPPPLASNPVVQPQIKDADSEVVQLRQQVQQLLKRVQELEQQSRKAEKSKESL